MKQQKYNIVMLILAGIFALSNALHAQGANSQWRFMGLRGRIVQKLQLHDGHIYVTTDNGLYQKKIQDADTLWTPIGLQHKNARALLVFNADTILASVEFEDVSLYRTTDGGQTWSPYQNGFGGEYSETVKSIARHPEKPNLFFATGYRVVAKSSDAARSWQPSYGVWQGFGTGTSFVKVDAANPDIIWAGGQNAIERAFLVKSIDGGESWKEWPQLVEDVSTVKTVAIDPHDSETVYAGMESFILKTTDGGDTWDEVFDEDARFFFGLAINPFNSERLYAASWFKSPDPQPLNMYISDNGGESWYTINEPNAVFGGVWDMQHINDGSVDKLYLGLYKGGVYEFTSDSPTSVDPDPTPIKDFALEPNYPNPFNPSTNIRFSLSNSGNVQLKIYNLLGQEIVTLVDRDMQAGTHSVTFNAENLTSGIYLYRLQLDGRSKVRRLTLLK